MYPEKRWNFRGSSKRSGGNRGSASADKRCGSGDFLHETDTREYKVSLRSKGKVNVSSIAQYFGGGGHVRAAGVTMKGSAHDVINNLLRQITLQLKEA